MRAAGATGALFALLLPGCTRSTSLTEVRPLLPRVVVDTFRSDGPVRAPLGFHAAVMDRIEAEHPEVPWWQQFLRRPFGIPAQGWGVVLAAAAVLVVVQVGRDDGEVAPEVDDPVWRDVPAAVEKAPAAAKLEEGGGEALRAAEPEAAPERPPKPSPEPVAEDVQSGKGPLDEKMALKAKELEAARAADQLAAPGAQNGGKTQHEGKARRLLVERMQDRTGHGEHFQMTLETAVISL